MKYAKLYPAIGMIKIRWN